MSSPEMSSPPSLVLCVCFVALFVGPSHQAWQAKTWGPKRQHCHCLADAQCDASTGKCPKGCAPPYGGITCQSAGIHHVLPGITPGWAAQHMDTDPATCAAFTGNEVKINMDEFLYFFFIDILRASGGAGSFGADLKTTMWSDPTRDAGAWAFQRMDVSADKFLITPKHKGAVRFQNLSITNLPLSVCELVISVGRNLAVHGKVTQSSEGPKRRYILVNDGNLSDKPADCGATLTTQSDPTRWMQIAFETQAFVNVISVIWPVNKKCQLSKFKITYLYDDQKTVVDKYDFVAKNVSQQYNVQYASSQAISVVRVSVKKVATSKDPCEKLGWLEVCELQVFGEFACKPGNFGPTCEKSCPTCGPGKCDSDHGCVKGCGPGRKGKFCDAPCPGATWGQDCKQKCANNCTACEGATGECTKCPDGTEAPKCFRCKDGTYGPKCEKACGEHCRTTQCDRETGVCIRGCIDEYTGEFCKKEPLLEKQIFKILVLVLLVIVVIDLLLAIIICCCCDLKKKETDSKGEEKTPNEDEKEPGDGEEKSQGDDEEKSQEDDEKSPDDEEEKSPDDEEKSPGDDEQSPGEGLSEEDHKSDAGSVKSSVKGSVKAAPRS